MTIKEIQLDNALRWLAGHIQKGQGIHCTVFCPAYNRDDAKCTHTGPRLPCASIIYEEALRAVGGADAEHKEGVAGVAGVAGIIGQWPGDETDEEIEQALSDLS